MRLSIKLLAAVLFLSVLPVYAASLINLEVDFETPLWSEFLKNNWGPSAAVVKRPEGGHALKIETGRALKTQIFRLPAGGKVRVGFDLRNHGNRGESPKPAFPGIGTPNRYLTPISIWMNAKLRGDSSTPRRPFRSERTDSPSILQTTVNQVRLKSITSASRLRSTGKH